MPTAAAVIVGNEILNGKFADANSPWLAVRCAEIGLDLLRVSVIPDDVPTIGSEVAQCSALVDHVFTTGGVGSTHDDVTMAGIAHGFGLRLVVHPDLKRMLEDKLADRMNEAALRMATIPEGAQLWWEGDLFFPVVNVRNVCVFPGVPSLFRRKFDSIAQRFSGEPMQSRKLVTAEPEVAIAARLEDMQNRWPGVAIGSYPQFDEKPWTVTVTLDSRDVAALDACYKALIESLGSNLIDSD